MIVPLEHAGKHLDPPVTRQAIQTWIREGCDCKTPDGLIDTEKAQAWRVRFRRDPDTPGANGGRRKGAGRPKGSTNKAGPTKSAPTPARPLPLTEQEILDRNARGELTAAELDQARDAVRAMTELRENARAAGELINVAEAEHAWTTLLQSHKEALEELPDRVSVAVSKALLITPEQAQIVRAIAAEEIRDIVTALMHAPCLPGPSEPSSTTRRR